MHVVHLHHVYNIPCKSDSRTTQAIAAIGLQMSCVAVCATAIDKLVGSFPSYL